MVGTVSLRSLVLSKVGCLILLVMTLVGVSFVLLALSGHKAFSSSRRAELATAALHRARQQAAVGYRQAGQEEPHSLVGSSLLKSRALPLEDQVDEQDKESTNCTVSYEAVQPNLKGLTGTAIISRNLCQINRRYEEFKNNRKRQRKRERKRSKRLQASPDQDQSVMERSVDDIPPPSSEGKTNKNENRRNKGKARKRNRRKRNRKSLGKHLRSGKRTSKRGKDPIRRRRHYRNSRRLRRLAVPALKSFWADGEAYRDWKRRKGLEQLLELPTAQLAIQQLWQGLIKKDPKWSSIYEDMHKSKFPFSIDSEITLEQVTKLGHHHHREHLVHPTRRK